MADVSASVRSLGAPKYTTAPSTILPGYSADQWRYSWNIWDMHAHDGRIFLGHGNSNNSGPAANMGSHAEGEKGVPVFRYDPEFNRFVRDGLVDDEQIDVFRVLDGKLVIPGHDPREPWTKGNFYRREGMDDWAKVRTIPWGIHNYDMIEHGSSFYAALGTPTGAAIARSDDKGQTWSELRVLGFAGRARTFFVLGECLYASLNDNTFYEVRKESLHKVTTSFFPTMSFTASAFLTRAVSFKNKLAYIGALAGIDHNWHPVALYVASGIHDIRGAKIPNEVLPRDILVRGNRVYVLASTGVAPDVVIQVYVSEDLQSFRELFRFKCETFARSFEEVGGDFYFGLGCEALDLSPLTGTVLRLSGGAQ